MNVLVINCGSSSIKYQLFSMPSQEVITKGFLEKIGEEDSFLHYEIAGKEKQIERIITDHEHGIKLIIEILTDTKEGAISSISEILAVGHRVVHGGEEFTGSVLIDEKVTGAITHYCNLAPLHNPPNLAGIQAIKKLLPDVPQVACFDTAFHQTIPEHAFLYALPYEVYKNYGIRRYGFHGTSHRYITRRASRILNIDKYEFNCITMHLGNGCSMTAVKGGKSIDTSMGFTPLEGLVMGTRSGDIDPAIIFYLEKEKGLKIDEIDVILNRKSGLLGMSGISNDMRSILGAAESGNKRAELTLDIFCYRIKKYIGAYLAVVGNVHALIFAGGIGENAPSVRSRICKGLEPLGISLSETENKKIRGSEGRINVEGSPIKILVIPTNEERSIAGDTYEIVG